MIVLEHMSGEGANFINSSWCYGECLRTRSSGDFPAECVYVLPTITEPPAEILVCGLLFFVSLLIYCDNCHNLYYTLKVCFRLISRHCSFANMFYSARNNTDCINAWMPSGPASNPIQSNEFRLAQVMFYARISITKHLYTNWLSSSSSQVNIE